MFKIVDEKLTMEDLLSQSEAFEKPKLGSVVTGHVVSLRKNHVVVDLNGVAVGMISGVETHDSADTMKDLVVGDEVKAVVVEDENEDGMVVLSLRKASQANAWDRFEKAYKDGEIVEITVNEANKGGLLLDVDGIKGFIPVSQLAPVHYPRVDGADASQILIRLKKLVGQKFNVKVINIDRASGKMILSERAAIQDQSSAALNQLNVGDVVAGTVSGVVKFGIFVAFNGLEGLVHISEIAWGHVSNPHQYAKVGDKVDVQIIGIEKNKLSLSMKRLIPDPWEEIAAKYPIGGKVKGVINRFSQFGAFVQLEDDINGLIHLSEISDQKVEDPREFLSIGDEAEAIVINIDRDEHRIGLSLKQAGGAKAKKPKKKAAEEPVPGTAAEPSGDTAEITPQTEQTDDAVETPHEASSDEVKEEKPKKKAAKKAAKAKKDEKKEETTEEVPEETAEESTGEEKPEESEAGK
ncbi:S1 RNA-binding domain-containing protein [Candidatus Peregrinibacteria bacterium]|nr:S1 RNA-binding domain-containing protein [Candidatus Peregrinibacteria bacterium]